MNEEIHSNEHCVEFRLEIWCSHGGHIIRVYQLIVVTCRHETRLDHNHNRGIELRTFWNVSAGPPRTAAQDKRLENIRLGTVNLVYLASSILCSKIYKISRRFGCAHTQTTNNKHSDIARAVIELVFSLRRITIMWYNIAIVRTRWARMPFCLSILIILNNNALIGLFCS